MAKTAGTLSMYQCAAAPDPASFMASGSEFLKSFDSVSWLGKDKHKLWPKLQIFNSTVCPGSSDPT